MDAADYELEKTLQVTVTNAVLRMKALKRPADRHCLFYEYKEWLGEDINNEVWAIPADFGRAHHDPY